MKGVVAARAALYAANSLSATAAVPQFHLRSERLAADRVLPFGLELQYPHALRRVVLAPRASRGFR